MTARVRLEDLSPADQTAVRLGRLYRRARTLAEAGDPAAIEAEATYVAARVAGEGAGLLMRRIEVSDLRDRHARILTPDAEVTVGVGWQPLVESLLDRLSGMDVVVPLIREKFGGLDAKIYPRQGWRREDFDAVGPVKATAVAESLRTCEACGAPATLRRDGRGRTRCDDHVDL